MTDFALPLPTAHRPTTHRDWLARVTHTLRVHARLARRRRLHAHGSAHDWMLALPQSRHGG